MKLCRKASVQGFAYSKSLGELGGKWDYEDLSQFLHKPKEYIKGSMLLAFENNQSICEFYGKELLLGHPVLTVKAYLEAMIEFLDLFGYESSQDKGHLVLGLAVWRDLDLL